MSQIPIGWLINRGVCLPLEQQTNDVLDGNIKLIDDEFQKIRQKKTQKNTYDIPLMFNLP